MRYRQCLVAPVRFQGVLDDLFFGIEYLQSPTINPNQKHIPNPCHTRRNIVYRNSGKTNVSPRCLAVLKIHAR